MTRYLRLGEAALTVEFGNEVSLELHRQVRAFCLAVEAEPPPAMIELVPTYRSVTIMFDPAHEQAPRLEDQLRAAEHRAASIEVRPGPLHVMPVHYGGEDGLDLQDVAGLHGLTPEQVVELHTSREYVVYAIGFTPGFTYLGGLPEELHTPRLGTPRLQVPAGSVGIGGQQTGIYPVASPGGWRLLGRTSFALFDVNADPPCPIQAGDRVRFESVATLPADATGAAPCVADTVSEPCLEVNRPGLFTTVQDLGRWGYQAVGVSVAGAMDPLALRAANQLVGNEPGAAGLEIMLLGPSLHVVRACTAAIAGAEMELRLNGRPAPLNRAMDLHVDDVLDIGRARRSARAYLALAGGIDVPLVLGSRSTYTRAGFGGLAGRPLRAGDTLRAGESVGSPSEPLEVPLPAGDVASVRVILGPQDGYFSEATIARFLSTEFEVSPEADRMGYRLSGETLTAIGPADIVSDGMTLGSIQVPPHGNPIVMLADRPSMGGYPKIATVISADVRLVAQSSPGMRLRFVQASLEEAWRALRGEDDGRLPVARVRALLTEMERSSARLAVADEHRARIELRRG